MADVLVDCEESVKVLLEFVEYRRFEDGCWKRDDQRVSQLRGREKYEDRLDKKTCLEVIAARHVPAREILFCSFAVTKVEWATGDIVGRVSFHRESWRAQHQADMSNVSKQ